MAEREKTLKRFKFVLPLLALLLAACGSNGSSRPTSVPGFPTQVFNQVNSELATQGLPTYTAGPDSESQVETAAAKTLTEPAPTVTRTPTNTPLPTATRVPGVETSVFDGVNGILATQGTDTLTPNPDAATDILETKIAATLTALPPTP